MASSDSLGLTRGPILTGKIYDVWSIKMKKFLQSEDGWEDIVNSFKEPDPVDLQEMMNAQRNVLGELKKKDNKSSWLIQQGLEEYIFSKVIAADHPKKAWVILEIAYQGTNKVKNEKL
jgi:hypothetical protein